MVLSFARNFSDKYSKSLMDKGIDVSKKFAKETAKATGDLIGNKIADKITSVPKNHMIKLIMNTERKIYFSKRQTENY